ncbi:MAG: response regulator [Magnetococcales bacterium]|nr:response regulator [Magnetococcales bacterium]
MNREEQNVQSILVVDDETDNIELFHEILADEYRIFFATNGSDCLKIADLQRPNLILLDILMPDMDGYEVCRLLKADPALKEIPVIFISAMQDVENESVGFGLGAIDFLVKPTHPLRLKNRVRVHLDLQRQKQALEQNRNQLSQAVFALKERTATLKSQEEQLQSILDHAMDAIITINDEGQIMDFNPASEELFGYAKHQVIGRDLANMLDLPDLHQDKRFQSTLPGESQPVFKRRFEAIGVRSDGNSVELSVGVASITRNGKHFFTAFLQDVTDRKQLLRSLLETLDVAESSNRIKSEFLANMSHEIRSPMNAIMGMTELVLTSNLTEDQRENLEIVQNSANTLLRLINDILDFSKIEAGQLTLERLTFDLRGRIENVSEMLAVLVHKSELELYCDIDPDIPTLVGDPLRLNQIIFNLVNNAIKFTSEGEITIVVERMAGQPRGDQTVVLHFLIADTGIGIPKDRMKAIFNQFTQVDGSTTRQYGGTGLGLTISKCLVELMGGEIWVESKEGEGSIFHFTAQFGVGQRGDPADARLFGGMDVRQQEPGSSHLQGLHIIVADAHETGRRILVAMLSRYGASVCEVRDNQGLLDQLVICSQETITVDLILVDFGLTLVGYPHPDHPGHPLLDRANLLMMVPTHVWASRQEMEPRFQHIAPIKKPIKLFNLINEIDVILGRATKPEVEKASLFVPCRQTIPMRILLVEDLINNQKLATTILERVGHTVTLSCNGVEALERLSQEPFDLVLMDLHMQKMDGYEATLKIRQGAVGGVCDPQIPIVAVTARAMRSEEKRCLKAGMNAYLRKPYRAAELIETVKPYARKRQTHYKSPETAKQPLPALFSVEMEPEQFVTCRSLFLDGGLNHLQMIRQALSDRSVTKLLKEAEWFKKAAADVGAKRVKISAIRLKGKVEMKNWAVTSEMIVALEAEFEKASQALLKSLIE